MLRELLRRVARCAAARSAQPLPSAPLYVAVETVYEAYADEVFEATGAPGQHAWHAWHFCESSLQAHCTTERMTESGQGAGAAAADT